MLQFNVPLYMEFQKYQINDMNYGQCVTINTEYNNEKTGSYTLKGVNTVQHSYHCCGNNQLYGAIGFVAKEKTDMHGTTIAYTVDVCTTTTCTKVTANTHDLCASPAADYCALFGHNMVYESNTF